MKLARILIIEKDEALTREVTTSLRKAQYEVVRAVDALEGIKKLYEAYPDLIILDRELPTVNGEDPVLIIRQASVTPIIILGSQEEAAEILELGADAYMMKPPSLVELVARIRALLRRRPRDHTPPGDSKLDIENNHLANTKGSSEPYSTEVRLASCLALNKGRLLDYLRLTSTARAGKRLNIENLYSFLSRQSQN